MESLIDILKKFQIPNKKYEFEVISNGFINDTFLVSSNGEALFILQRINTKVFTNISALFHNLDMALPFLKSPDYKEIKLVKSKSGTSFIKSKKDKVWRLMTFIKNSVVFNTSSDPEIAFETGRIVGLFHKLTSSFNVEKLENTLPKFHDVAYRYDQFKVALSNAESKRKEQANDAITFINENISMLLEIQIDSLPKRTCHNDTKLNNILFSNTNKALCLIDLDTIMKGTFLYDFGDAVRTVVNTAKEDEKDLSKINFNSELFEAFVNGLALHGNILSKKEKELLPLGVVLMPFLHGIRALTDYLGNNKYYKVNYESQNLDRSISLFTFAKFAIKNQKTIRTIIKEKLDY
jgi:aminoglycoside phosphotransferase (APT) family kinase protein